MAAGPRVKSGSGVRHDTAVLEFSVRVVAESRRLSEALIEVKLYEHRVTEESVPKIIEKLTDALHESSGAAKEHIHVIVQGVSPKHWGMNGKPGA